MIAAGWFRFRVVLLQKICSLNFKFLLFFLALFQFLPQRLKKLLCSLQNATVKQILSTSSKMFASQITTARTGIENVQRHMESPIYARNAGWTTTLLNVRRLSWNKDLFVSTLAIISSKVQFEPFIMQNMLAKRKKPNWQVPLGR